MNNIDKFNTLSAEFVEYNSIISDINSFVIKEQLLDKNLWKIFVNQFRVRKDSDDGKWRGEFFGKMMRGACLTYSLMKDCELYSLLESVVCDFLTTQDSLGRFSTYSLDKEFTGWDMWGRKYAMLGLLYFYEICKDDNLKEKIVVALSKHADYIVNNVGKTKRHPIAYAESYWHHAGLPACSILEPFVKLYKITNKKTYLDFATEIIETGFTNNGENLVETFCRGKKAPNKLLVKKAYEMMSCFQGLLEYYKIIKDKKYLIAINNFVQSIIEYEYTEIGGIGTHHEFFNDSVKTQTDYINYPMIETCVTVTFMNLCYHMLLFTGESKYADYLEKSAYNAMFGAVNTEKNKKVFSWSNGEPSSVEMHYLSPFDSYSPIIRQNRAIDLGGFVQLKENGMKYGCCMCISSLGTAISGLYGILKTDNEYVINSYEECNAELTDINDKKFNIKITGNYFLKDEKVKIIFDSQEKITVNLKLRIPYWSTKTIIRINGKDYCGVAGEYFNVNQEFVSSDFIEIELDTAVKVKELNDKQLLKKCQYVLAMDERYGDNLDKTIKVVKDAKGTVDARRVSLNKFKTLGEFEVQTEEGTIKMCDYSSAGKQWDNKSGTRVSVWL